MKTLTTSIFAILFCIYASPAGAEEITGSDLQRMCSSRYDTDYGFCAGYITAVANLMVNQRVDGMDACGHEPIRSQQLIDIMTGYLERNKDKLHLPARTLIATALNAAFTCTR